MKKFLLMLILSFMTVPAFAQITWNVKGGVGFAHCYGSGLDGGHLSPIFVGKAGAGIEVPFNMNWSLMPSLEIAYKGFKVSDSEYDASSKAHLLYLQVPVLAAYRININDSWNTTIKAGPYFAVAVYGSEDFNWEGERENIDIFADGYCNRCDVGIDFGVDFEYHRFVFGLEYEVGFISIAKEGSVNNAALYATVGYKF